MTPQTKHMTLWSDQGINNMCFLTSFGQYTFIYIFAIIFSHLAPCLKQILSISSSALFYQNIDILSNTVIICRPITLFLYINLWVTEFSGYFYHINDY